MIIRDIGISPPRDEYRAGYHEYYIHSSWAWRDEQIDASDL